MIARLLVCWTILAALLGATPAKEPDPDPLKLGEVYTIFRATVPELDYSVHWHHCGYLNAFYVPGTHRLELCSEIINLGPGVVRFIVAHELAHAVITQRDIPYTGSQEAAADELAAVLLTFYDHAGDVLMAAKWWQDQNGEGSYPHPPDRHRAHAIAEVVFGPLINPRPYRTWALLLEATTPE